MATGRQAGFRIGWLAGLFLLQLGLATFEAPVVRLAGAVDDSRVIRLVDGNSTTLRELARGRPLLLVFWTTWCAYCAPELERGVALAADLAAGATPVELLFVNVREPAAVVDRDPQVDALRRWIALDERGSLAEELGVRGYPAYGLLDPQGKLLWLRHGLDVDVRSEVRAALAGGGRG